MAVALEKLVDAVCAAVISNAEQMTTLDAAIGDADHGLNMRRGFEAVLADKAKLIEKPLPEALKSIGMTLVMRVGGASGPLYGTLFLSLGQALPEQPGIADVASALHTAIDAIKARGKADFNNKTMLDVLGPVADHLASGSATLGSLRALAEQSAEATVPMKATKGRASYLGDRSIGHMDPGSFSSALMIKTICDVLEQPA